MKSKLIFALIVTLLCVRSNAQTISFTPSTQIVHLGKDEVEVKVGFSVGGTVPGKSYTINVAAQLSAPGTGVLWYTCDKSSIPVEGDYPFGTITMTLRSGTVAGSQEIKLLGAIKDDATAATTAFLSPILIKVYNSAPIIVPNMLSAKDYETMINNEQSKYTDPLAPLSLPSPMMVQPAVLDSNLNLVFANVIFGSDGTAQSGSVAAITSDKDKGTASTIVTLPRKISWLGNAHLSATVAASASNGIFNFFTSDKFYSSASGGIGATWIMRSSQFLPDRNDKEKMNKWETYYHQRKIYAGSMKANFERLSTENIALIEAELKDIDGLINSYKTDAMGKLPDLKIDELYAKRNELQTKRDSVEDLQTIFVDATNTIMIDRSKPNKRAKAALRNGLAGYDYANNDLLNGYSVKWWNLKANFSNYAFNIADDSLPKVLRDTLTIKNTFSFQLNGSFNWSTYSKKSLCFFSVQGALERSSYLNNPALALTGKPLARFDTTASVFNVFSDEDDGDKKIGRYEDIHHGCWYASLKVYYARFFGSSKALGFDVMADYHVVLTNIPGTYQPNSFNILLGPVLRVAGESDVSKATIGLKAGVVNALPNTHVWKESFGIKLEVGVPFSWYEKKKEEK